MSDGTSRALRLVFGTLLPVAGIVLAGMFLYQRPRRAYLIDRDQRAIATLRDQIHGRLEAVATMLSTHDRTCQGQKMCPEVRGLKGLALATGITAGLPMILKVLTMFGDQRTGAASS